VAEQALPIGASVDRELRQALVASRALERQIMALAEDPRLDAMERGRRIGALVAKEAGRTRSLSDAWVAAGRPAPLGFLYNQRADRTEWFDGWLEVESLVLQEEARGLARDDIERMILESRPPFDEDLEAEELGVIYRSNEQPPSDR
jgi:hypothetical protein